MVKKRHHKVSSWHIALNSFIGILIFLILQASWDLVHGDVSVSRIITFQVSGLVLLAISIHVGIRKVIALLMKQFD